MSLFQLIGRLPRIGRRDCSLLRVAPWIVLLAALGPVVAPARELLVENPADVGPELAEVIARYKIPGMTAIVLRGDRIVAMGSAGVRKKGTNAAVTLADKFEISSCSKAMTATLVASLVQEGKLQWTTTLAEIFGDTMPDMKPAWKNVTVRQVLDHRCGLNHDPIGLLIKNSLFGPADLREQRQRCARKLLSREPDLPPGSKFVYTSAAYVVLGAILEKASGQSWEDMMKERLFGPLDMTTGGFGAPRGARALDQPWGHGYRFYSSIFGLCRADTPLKPTCPLADVPRIAAPAGLVHMSIGDWAKFAFLHLRADPANPQREVALLNADTFSQLKQPLPDNEVPPSWGGGTYAGGWVISTARWAKGPREGDRGRVLWHAGDNSRWNSVLLLAPEIDFAVLVVCNRAYMWGPCGEAARTLIDEFATKPGETGTGLVGHWHGELSWSMLSDIRFVVEIDEEPREKAGQATLVSLDYQNERIAINALTLRDGRVHFETAKGGRFDGKLSADKSQLIGRWKQDVFDRTIVFKRGP